MTELDLGSSMWQLVVRSMVFWPGFSWVGIEWKIYNNPDTLLMKISGTVFVYCC